MKILVTGGLGFIGANTVKYFYDFGHEVDILDNVSRTFKNVGFIGMNTNAEKFIHDIRDRDAVENIIKKGQYDLIFHLAAQVAVTTSIVDPRNDFEVNVLGTLNILEAVRKYSPQTAIVYTSTNKVYGDLADIQLEEGKDDYYFKEISSIGINEERPLDFHSPYGCSKGAADQYVLDYSRIYGLKTCVLRQSCIYGPRQFGIEDQGWVAWFLIRKLQEKPVVIYGNGKQTRDLLYIDDLTNLYRQIAANFDKVNGEAFNIGGGHQNTMSVLQLVQSKKLEYSLQPERQGDQKIFVSDNSKIHKALDWTPTVNFHEGIYSLEKWISDNQNLINA